MTDETSIRKRLWSGDKVQPVDVGDLARDLGSRADSQPTFLCIDQRALYQEPMYLVPSRRPWGIIAVSVTSDDNPQSVVLTGGTVHWAWDSFNRCQINSVDGMTPSGIAYNFSWLVVFLPQVSR